MKKGFTLIEVLIVVIILGILATLAIPQFARMTRRARLAEAWAGLGGIRTAQAVYFMEWNAYAATIGQVDFDAPPDGIFAYTVVSGDAADFTADAIGNDTPSTAISAFITRMANGYSGV